MFLGFARWRFQDVSINEQSANRFAGSVSVKSNKIELNSEIPEFRNSGMELVVYLLAFLMMSSTLAYGTK